MEGQRLKELQKVVENRQMQKVEDVRVDVQTANLMLAVYSQLNAENRQKLDKMPFGKAAMVCWKLF